MASHKKREVQLDKNSGSKKLRDACNQEGAVDCYLLPLGVRDADDDAVLEYAISKGRLTLTFDRTILEDNPHVLAGRNPGMVLLRMDDDSSRRITRKTAMSLLRDFKQAFPEWNTVSWQHSFVELTPTLIFVYETTTQSPRQVKMLRRDSPRWQDELRSILEENARYLHGDT